MGSGGYDPGHLTLRPGTYWITVNDTSPGHDFELRGPTNTEGEGAGTPADLKLSGDALTDTGSYTTQVLLKRGWYRLFCAAPFHEKGGMYVDIEVGGVGQVG